MKLIISIFKQLLLFITLFAVLSVSAQETSQPDSTVRRADTSIINNTKPDSVSRLNPDTTADKDTTLTANSTSNAGIDSTRARSNAINAAINSTASDSSWVDYRNNIVHLFGNAKIKYEDFELTADYIRIEKRTNLLFASGSYDHNHKYRGRPIFKTQTEPPSTTDSLYYNFASKKGKVYGTFSDVEGGFIQARQLKKNEFEEASIKDAMYSTCNLPEPHTHFGIHISRGVVTEKNVVTGPAYLVIEDVPFPFITVPFAFFPKMNKRASGFLFPSFGEDYTRGFFMRDIGWYIGFNDYWDTEIRGSLYSKGSYEGSLRARYRKNYKYDGGFSLRYASTRTGVEGTPGYTPSKDFNITWNHSKRPESNPGTTFSASVNVGTGSYFSKTAAGGSYDYDQITRNSMSSSISFGKIFGDGRFNFTSSLSHRQDISAGTVFLELPSFNLNMTSFNPFDSKDRIGEQKWFQRINVGYSLQGRNSISSTESELFKSETLKKFRNGLQHNIPISLSLNALKFLQFNTSVNYTESWYLQTIRKSLDNTAGGYVQKIDTVPGFSRAYDYSLSSGFSTKFYGMKEFKGKLAAIRHVVTPSVNFNYRPDFSDARYGFYRRYQDVNGNEALYSIYENSVFGGPGSGESMGIGFSVDNNIEAKVRTADDSTGFKKIPILQSLSFNGNYNFVADSFKLSNINFSGRTALFDQKLGVSFNGSFDPYQYDPVNMRRVNQYTIKDGVLARLVNVGLSMDYSLNSEATKSRNKNIDDLNNAANGAMTPEQSQQLARISSDPNAFVDFKVPWNIAASFSFYYSKPGVVSSITSTLNLYGDVNLTPKWKVQYNTGYDFKAQKIILTQFNIYRDLHCWDMSFGWIPFGTYRSYTFTLRVKASILQDLKLNKRNDYYNSF